MTENQAYKISGLIFLVTIGILGIMRLTKSLGSDRNSTKKEASYSICDCENAYRALMYGEGSHAENKYTGEKYRTLNADGKAYMDIIDKCATLYGNDGKPLSEGGFSKYPAYQECLEKRNEPSNQTTPDTLIVSWNPETYHILQLDKIGGYLYTEPWNPKGFVMVFKGMEEEDKYGRQAVKILIQGHYKVSRKFQLEAKKYASEDFYRWKTWTSTEPGTFGTFIKCQENHNFDQSKMCDCSFILPD